MSIGRRERCTVNWYRICFILCSLKKTLYEQFIETNYNDSEREQGRVKERIIKMKEENPNRRVVTVWFSGHLG